MPPETAGCGIGKTHRFAHAGSYRMPWAHSVVGNCEHTLAGGQRPWRLCGALCLWRRFRFTTGSGCRSHARSEQAANNLSLRRLRPGGSKGSGCRGWHTGRLSYPLQGQHRCLVMLLSLCGAETRQAPSLPGIESLTHVCGESR
jgi:hypothetical protein